MTFFNLTPKTEALYLSVKHLSTADAAKQLGKSPGTIKRMRSDFQRLKPNGLVLVRKQPVAPVVPDQPLPVRQRVAAHQHRVRVTGPSSSADRGSVLWANVSLAMPPQGVRFNAMGEAV